MREIDVQPNTPEWLVHRAKTRNASEAPIIMGVSTTKRSEFVRVKATGIEKEISRWTEEVLFARGHAVEPALRAYAEEVTGEDFYPVVGMRDDEFLGASFDGLSMDNRIIFEGKQTNKEKMEHIRQNGTLPGVDYWQIVQQFSVNEVAERCIYVVGDGSDDGTVHLIVNRADFTDAFLTLDAAWKQFDADVAAYTPGETAQVVVAAAVTALPAVSVQVNGEIKIQENFATFEKAARDFIDNKLIREPKTDQDFADLDLQIKAMKNAEAALDAAETQMLAQISAFDAKKKTKDMLAKLIRDNRLMAEKLLVNEKERRRGEIVKGGKDALAGHIDQINKTLGGKIRMPEIAADFAGVVKGKRSISGLEDAVSNELARAKIAANQVADRIRLNLEVLRTEAAGFETLFMDAQQLVTVKSEEDMTNLVKARVAAHKEAEQAKADKIAAEARQKLLDEQAAEAARQAEAAKPVPQAIPVAAVPVSAAAGANVVPVQEAGAAPTPATVTPIRRGLSAPMPKRPSDAEIVNVLAAHYHVHESTVIEWLCELDLSEACTESARESHS